MSNSVVLRPYKWEINETIDNTIIYIHGIDKDNNRVTVKVPDFKPYVYLELDSNVKWTLGKVEMLKSFLKNSLKDTYPLKIQFKCKKKNYYYKEGSFLWMAFNNKNEIRKLERIVNKHINIFGIGKIKLNVHEQRASSLLQLFAMRKIKPCEWIIAKKTTKASILNEYTEQYTFNNIEMLSSYSDISSAESLNINTIIKPNIMSYDIECISGDKSGNTFPNPSLISDQIICIAATIANLYEDPDKWDTYILVNECDGKKCRDNLPNCKEVRHFSDEKNLIIGWRDFILEKNPDIITGYNTLSFDDNYIFKRANIRNCWSSFSKLGRIIEQKSTLDKRKWNSSAYGDQEFNYIDISGRLHIDMYPVISRDFGNLMSYNLDYVSEYFLGDNKIDLPAKDMIKKWHEGGIDNITEICSYCNKDTVLPLKLMKKLNTWIGLLEMSNVMLVPIFDLITRGQQIRMFSQVYCMAYDMNIVCTEKWIDYTPTDEEKIFMGATVQNPMEGYWEKVATFDFCSLYPSTIIAYNLCFSTFVPKNENPPEEHYNTLSWEDHSGCEHDTAIRKSKVTKKICRNHKYRFYKANIKKGIVPILLEQLLKARANTKKEIKSLQNKLKTITNIQEKNDTQLLINVLDKRQNGYKVSANSVSEDTPIPCLVNDTFNYLTIEELGNTWTNDNNGNQVSIPNDIKVWSDKGWTKVNYVIRHPLKKSLLCVKTSTGMVECTDEHSLLNNKGESVKPVDLQKGDKLLHNCLPLPKDTPKKPDKNIQLTLTKLEEIEHKKAFIYGAFLAKGYCSLKEKIWEISNINIFILEDIQNYLNSIENINFKLDAIPNNKNGCSFLRPTDNDVYFIHKYYKLFYDNKGRKRVPNFIYSSSYKIRLEFIKGYYHFTNKYYNMSDEIIIKDEDQIRTAELNYVLKSLGYKSSISKNRLIFEENEISNPTEIIDISNIKSDKKYVYDIETENHHFAAGIGDLIVHNSMYGGFGSDYSYTPFYPAAASTTAMGRRSIQQAIEFTKKYRKDTVVVYGDTDSMMVHFSSILNIKDCFKVCEDLETKINDIFPKPMYLELEKIYSKYFLLSKKRYVGYIVNKNNELISTDKKGVVIKRRDNCAYLREIYTELINMIMDKKPRWVIYKYLSIKIDELLKGNVDLNKLIITKSIKDNYKSNNLPHVAVAEKMKSRGKYVVSGTRINYIFVKTDNNKDPQYLKAEDPDWYIEKKGELEIDYLYYFEKQLINPLDEVLQVKYGIKNALNTFLKIIKKNNNITAIDFFSPKFKISL